MLLEETQRLTGTVDTDIASAANLKSAEEGVEGGRLLWKHVLEEEKKLGKHLEETVRSQRSSPTMLCVDTDEVYTLLPY
jgi:hypothetical protein